VWGVLALGPVHPTLVRENGGLRRFRGFSNDFSVGGIAKPSFNAVFNYQH
jgi:hypothetical protein